MAAVGLGGPAKAAVVADVDGAIRADRRAVRSAAEIGDDLDRAVGQHAAQRAARDLDQQHRAVVHRDRSLGKLQPAGDLADLHRRASGGRARGRGRPRRSAAIVPRTGIKGNRSRRGHGAAVRQRHQAGRPIADLQPAARRWFGDRLRGASAGRPTCSSVNPASANASASSTLRPRARGDRAAPRRSPAARSPETRPTRSRARAHRRPSSAASGSWHQREAVPVAELALRVGERDRVVRRDQRTGIEQQLDQRERRRLAQVVGARLEREAPDRDAAAAQAAATGIDPLQVLEGPALLPHVDLADGLQHQRPHGMAHRGVAKRCDVLREARSAVADARPQEVAPDPRIAADAVAHFLDVGAGRIGDRRDLVHEADARREHRVGGVLAELGAARRHLQHRHAALERTVRRRAAAPRRRRRARRSRCDRAA